MNTYYSLCDAHTSADEQRQRQRRRREDKTETIVVGPRPQKRQFFFRGISSLTLLNVISCRKLRGHACDSSVTDARAEQ